MSRRRRKDMKLTIITIVFFAISIGIAATILYIADNKYVFASYFSKEQMLSDYEYFWEKLEENWPYFDTANENKIDLNKLKSNYKSKIKGKPADINFYNIMSDLAADISSHEELGKVYAVDYYSQIYMNMEPRYALNKGISDLLNDKATIQRYRYIDTRLLIKIIDNYSPSQIVGGYTPAQAQDSFNKNVQVEIIEEGKIAKITINAFFLSEFNENMINAYEENFKEIYKNLSNYEHVIFDLSSCVGTNATLWKNFIVAPNIKSDASYDITCIYNNTENNKKYYDVESKPISELAEINKSEYLKAFDSYFKHTIKVESKPYEKNIANAKKWIITGEKTKLEVNNFVNFAKETGFATIVGNNLNGLDVPLGVAMIQLPELGLIIAYDGLEYLDASGMNRIDEIKADILVPVGENALEACLAEIRK